MARFVRVSIGFAVVFAAYLTYATVAVPLIEPPAAPPVASLEQTDVESAPEYDRWRRSLAGLLPGANWPLEKAKILASNQLHLIFWDYNNLGDGKVEIRPCAIIYTPEAPELSEQERFRRAIVLEAPDGAMLEFDEPLSLSRMKIGKLKGGRLTGRVTIRSAGKRPGPEDDLMVVAHNVELDENRVWTPHPVEFRLGPNHGRGQKMLIKLLAGEQSSSKAKHGPDIAGIELFEVRRLDRLHLELGGARIAGGSPTPAAMAAGEPIEVSCNGPFRFEPMRQLVTFEDRVNVLQLHPDGQSDQLECDLLSIYLARSRSAVDNLSGDSEESGPAGDDSSPRKAAWDLKPRRIEAWGNPVIVSAPSQGVEVRGQRLDYDFQNGRIVLDGTDEVFLQQGDNKIHARSLQYQPGRDGALGQVVARGPGRLDGQMQGRLARGFRAVWGEQLQIRPVDGQQVISLTGGAELDYGGVGGLAAAAIHFWLSEANQPEAPPDGPKQLRPDRMLATGDVELKSAQLIGKVQQLEVWFEQQVPGELPAAGYPVAAVRGRTPYRDAAVVPTGFAGPLRTVRRTGREPIVPLSGTPVGRGAPTNHFEISGKLLRARMVFPGGPAALTELMIEGDVRLTETQTAKPDEQPVVVCGDRIHVVDASQPHAAITVTGKPAHFEGRGLGLTGTNINLNSGTNRLWIDGSGRMDLPWQRDFQGHALPGPGSLAVHWQQRMTFDGRTASFEGSVVGRAPHQTVRTETLHVTLKEAIRFDQPPKGGPKVDIDRVRCLGGVLMESQSFDEIGLSSTEKMQLGDLDINLTTGQTTASGPGWMTTVRRGSGDLLGSPATARTIALRSAESDADPNRLTYLSVRFRGSIVGNLHNQEMTFHDQVRTAYGPVDSWNATPEADDLESLGPKGVLLSCDRLKVSQMATPGTDRRAVELEATGSVSVEGQAFTARAVRMTYTQAKELLLLEGDGRSDAQLYYQPYVGAPYSETAAQQIWYWRLIPKVQVRGVKSFQWTGPPGSTPGTGK